MARILLVDDEKVSRALYSDYLTGAGHLVTAVGSIDEAKAALGSNRYDAVVTDLLLPKGDGMEVLQHAKESQLGIEVIVITGLNKVDPAVRAIKSGAAEYLVKPVAPEALQHAVMRALTTR
ncbi:MAG TPA: response regulator, partial [Myxococcaceae bacterium]|nr:response regulator [Myxococcaceae bacterium]